MAIGVLFGIPILILITYLPGYLILAPLRRAALEPRPPVQFRTAEILLLTLQIGAMGALLLGGRFDSAKAVGFAILAILLITWWVLGVRWLSHAGVTQASARMWILAVAVPLAFGVLAGLFLFLGFAVAVSSGDTTTFGILGWQIEVSNATARTVFLAIQIAALSLAIGHIPFCRWMVRRALRTREGGVENLEAIGN